MVEFAFENPVLYNFPLSASLQFNKRFSGSCAHFGYVNTEIHRVKLKCSICSLKTWEAILDWSLSFRLQTKHKVILLKIYKKSSKKEIFARTMLIEKLLNASLLWKYKGGQGENIVYREHKRIVCSSFTLIVTCQTFRFCCVVSESLMLLQNVCRLLRWTEASRDQAFLKVLWHFYVLSLMEVPFGQPFPQCFGATRLGFV